MIQIGPRKRHNAGILSHQFIWQKAGVFAVAIETMTLQNPRLKAESKRQFGNSFVSKTATEPDANNNIVLSSEVAVLSPIWGEASGALGKSPSAACHDERVHQCRLAGALLGRYQDDLAIMIAVVIVIVIIPVLLIAPAMLVLVPPFVVLVPAPFTSFAQLVPRMIGVATGRAMVLDSLMQSVVCLRDAVPALFISLIGT